MKGNRYNTCSSNRCLSNVSKMCSIIAMDIADQKALTNFVFMKKKDIVYVGKIAKWVVNKVLF